MKNWFKKKIFINVSILLSMLSLSVVNGRYGSKYGEIDKIEYAKHKKDSYSPAGMVYIKGKVFMNGSYGNKIANKEVKISESPVGNFYMDAFCITNRQYKEFLKSVKNENSRKTDGTNQEKDEEFLSDEDKDEKEFFPEYNQDKDLLNLYVDKVMVSPDLSVWKNLVISNDLEVYSFLDNLFSNYFTFKNYDNFPIVAVSYQAAILFAKWRTKMLNAYRESKKLPLLMNFRLPTKAEYLYASKGAACAPKYSFGGQYPINNRGELIVNIKASRGNLLGPLPNDKEREMPNSFGLYDMSGNISSWISSNDGKISKKIYYSAGGTWASTAYHAEVGNIKEQLNGAPSAEVSIRYVMSEC